MRSGFKHYPDGFEVEFIEGSITDRQAVRQAMASFR